MNKLKKYVPGSISLSLACVMALGGSYDLGAKETLNVASIEAADDLSNGSSQKITQNDLRRISGFAQHVPVDADLFFNISKTEDIVQYLRKSAMGSMLADLAKSKGGNIDEVIESPEFKEFLNVAGEEVFMAIGDGAGKIVKDTGDMYAVYYQGYYSFFGEILLDLYKGEDFLSSMDGMEARLGTLMGPMLDKALEIENYKMPSMYVGFKVSNDEDRKRYLDLILSALKNASALNDYLPGMEIPFETDSTDRFGGFKGVKIDYNKWMDQMTDSPEMGNALKMMGMDEEYMKKYQEKFKDFKFSVLAGEYQDYVVIYLGDGAGGLKFVEDSSKSLLSNPEMAFLSEYQEKEMVSISYISKDITEAYQSVSTFMEDFTIGINKVLSGTEILGDTKHIQVLLTKMAKNGRKAVELTPASRIGSVGYIEDGFKIDSFHGSKSAVYDLDTKRKLSKIALRDNAVFSANWVSNEERAELNTERLEDLVNLVYQTTKMVVDYDQEIEDEDFQEFAAIFKMLDAQFSDELLELWSSAKIGMQQGMGNETAVLIDLEGKLPRVPDVPTIVLENGKIPRLAIGSDVVSRDKMAESWKGLDAGGRKITKKVEELVGQKFNYRTSELAKKEGIDFWSYQLGITSHEANLALGINDRMAFATTSPSLVESFVADYDVAGNEAGVDLKIRIAPVRDYVKHWIKFVGEKGEEMGEGFDRDDFLEAKKIADQCLKASKELDSLDYSVRKVSGEVRSFFHFNKAN